jgi:AhpD family alkylhydroperoxidase
LLINGHGCPNINLKGEKSLEIEMICEKVTPWYVLNSPETGQPFQDFYDAVTKGGVLDKKTRELLMLSLASAFRCPHCTESHIKAALEAGVTKEEITEALLITAVEAAGTQLNWAKDIYLKYLNTTRT